MIPLLHPTTGQSISFVANEVKIQGVSGDITNLKLDFLGQRYRQEDDLQRNTELADASHTFLFEAVFETKTGE